MKEGLRSVVTQRPEPTVSAHAHGAGTLAQLCFPSPYEACGHLPFTRMTFERSSVFVNTIHKFYLVQTDEASR